MFFHALHGGNYESADVMWTAVRSFELKLQILNNLVPASDLSDTEKARWRVVSEYIPSQYRLRNQVVHSTPIDMIDGPSKRQCVLPFMSLFGKSTKALDAATIEEYALSFAHLRDAICSVNPGLKKSGKRRHKSQEPEHDLIRRLQKEDDRKREAQRHRALAWRQYLERNPNLKLD